MSTASEWDVELNTRRKIPYLRAPLYYFVYHINSIALYAALLLKTLTTHVKSPSTRIRINLKTDKYLYGYEFRPHVNGVFTHRKQINLKTLSRVDKFENAG